MKLRYKVLISSILLLAAFALGRFTVPEKVRVEIKTVEVIREVKQTETDLSKTRHKKVTETITIKPDGTKIVTRVITDDTQTDKKSDTSSETDTRRSTDEKRETVRGASPVTLSALAGVRFANPLSLTYGLSATKPLLGPVTLGAWGLSSGEVGLSLGLTF